MRKRLLIICYSIAPLQKDVGTSFPSIGLMKPYFTGGFNIPSIDLHFPSSWRFFRSLPGSYGK
jgi:hypothetical protein